MEVSQWHQALLSKRARQSALARLAEQASPLQDLSDARDHSPPERLSAVWRIGIAGHRQPRHSRQERKNPHFRRSRTITVLLRWRREEQKISRRRNLLPSGGLHRRTL